MSEQTAEQPVETESEFGRGLGYCLGLFLAHAERLNKFLVDYEVMREKFPDSFDEGSAVDIWFNGAADHFGELEVDHAPEELRERMTVLRDKCLRWRISLDGNSATVKDAHWALQEAKDLLRLIDEAHGVPTCQGQYE